MYFNFRKENQKQIDHISSFSQYFWIKLELLESLCYTSIFNSCSMSEFLPTTVCGAGGEPNHQLPSVSGAAC